MKNKRILIKNGNQQFIKQKGGIPVIPKKNNKLNLADYFLENIGVADGLLDAGETEKLIKWNSKKYASLNKSNYIIGYSVQYFVVNKKNSEILKDINSAISEMHYSLKKDVSLMEIICSRYTDNHYLCNI